MATELKFPSDLAQFVLLIEMRRPPMLTETRPELSATRTSTQSLLVVDNESTTRDICKAVAAGAGFQVYNAATSEEALEILDRQPIDIVLADLQVPQMGGLELLKRIRANNPESAVIMLTQYGTIKT